MAAYRVFEMPNATSDEIADGRNVELVRDGFTFFALVFPVIWLLWNRVWFGVGLYIAISVLFIFASEVINPLFGLFLNLGLGFYLGLEATNWKAFNLSQKGWKEVDVVLAGNYEEAEMRAFSKRASSIVIPPEKATPSLLFDPPTRPVAKRTVAKTRPVIGAIGLRPAGNRS